LFPNGTEPADFRVRGITCAANFTWKLAYFKLYLIHQSQLSGSMNSLNKIYKKKKMIKKVPSLALMWKSYCKYKTNLCGEVGIGCNL